MQNAKPNPMVGAVIVAEDGRIIGEGYHVRCGEDLSEDVLADKEDEIQEDDEDEVVRSISEALKKNEDDLEVLDIQDVDDVDDVKRT